MVIILQFSFSLSYTGPKILLYTSLSKMFNCFLSLFVSVQVSDVFVSVLSIVFFSLNISFFDMFLFLKNICSVKYVLLAYFKLSFLQVYLVIVTFIKYNIFKIFHSFKFVIFYFQMSYFIFLYAVFPFHYHIFCLFLVYL